MDLRSGMPMDPMGFPMGAMPPMMMMGGPMGAFGMGMRPPIEMMPGMGGFGGYDSGFGGMQVAQLPSMPCLKTLPSGLPSRRYDVCIGAHPEGAGLQASVTGL